MPFSSFQGLVSLFFLAGFEVCTQTLLVFCQGGLLDDWSHVEGFSNNFLKGQMAVKKAVDHQTHRPNVVTSVIKLHHFPSENLRGRGGRNEERKWKKNRNRKSSFKIHERGK